MLFTSTAGATELAGYSFGIAQDNNGFIYQASQQGGFRLDGETHIPLADLYNVPNNWLEDVRYIKDKNQLLLAYGDLGLYKIDLTTNTTSQLINSGCWRVGLINDVIYCLRGHKLNSFEYQNGALTPLKLLPEGLRVNAIADGYIDTDDGLFAIDGNTAKLIDATPATYTKISNNKYGLIAWRDKTLYYYDAFGGKQKSTPWPTYPKSLYANGNTVYIEKNGAVVHLNLMDFSIINEKVNMVKSPVRRIFKDNSDNLWFISSNDVQIKPATINQLSLPYSSDYNIKKHFRNGFFVGTERGVLSHTSQSFNIIGNPNDYGYVTTDIAVIGDSLFIASNKGLTKYNYKNNEATKIYDKYVIALAVKSGELYVSTSIKGVFTYKNDIFEPLHDVNSLLHNNEILDVKFIDNDMYVLSAEGFYIKDKLQRVGYHGNEIGIVVDAVKLNGSVYIATFGNGLYKFINGELERLNSPQSIIDLQEFNSHLYVGTIDGVYKFADADYSLVSGTAGLNVTPNSMMLENESDLTFGTQYGITTIKLANKVITNQPQVTAVKTQNKYFVNPPSYRFNASSQTSFYLSDHNFIGNTEFAYAIDDNWIDSASGVINFHNIRPGNYTLRFKSRLNGGRWVEGEHLNLEFTGKWYESNIVTLLLFLLPALIIMLIIIFAVLLLKANYGVHKKLYNMIGSCKMNLALTKLLKAKSACSSPDLNKMADGLVYLDEAVDVIVPLAHGNAALGKRTIQQGLDALQAALQFECTRLNFEYTISFSDSATLDSGLERDIYALVYHSVRNSIDHGKASQVEVFVEQVRSQVHVTVIDDGKGCSLYTRTFKYGLGLYVMRDVAKRYKTKLGFKSSKAGTSIAIGFPLCVKSVISRNEKAPS
ncbi:ATP-binding protein [Pseudoalteromonas neustonica]|uniref:ATP-binding protein n=1 Tax=Pseudoalteromonas neustonica TaxID=1840331 RepID=A0ABU9U5S3_9GAMM